MDRDVGDAAQVAEAKTVEQLCEEREREELRQVLGTRAGRAVLWRMLERCGIYRTSFTGDPLGMAFREGERNIGLACLNLCLTADPRAYTIMRDEATIRNKDDGRQ